MFVFWAQDHVQGLLQALRLDFPSKMYDLDAYVSSYVTFCRFRRDWKVANPFLIDLGFLFFDCETWQGRVLCLHWKGFAVDSLNFQAVIESAANAASPKTQKLSVPRSQRRQTSPSDPHDFTISKENLHKSEVRSSQSKSPVHWGSFKSQ